MSVYSNKNAYFTPWDLGVEMCKPYRESIRKGECHILEPSGGDGEGLLKVIKWMRGVGSEKEKLKNVYTIESDPDFISILEAKDYDVIDHDFLTYQKSYYINLIVMNPPFDNGPKHFFKAWDILDEGHLCCLLNAENIRNPCTEERKNMIKMIKHFGGKIQFVQNAFNRSINERKTNVECVIIRMEKPAKQGAFDFTFKADREKEVSEFDFSDPTQFDNMVAKFDAFEYIVDCYKQCKLTKIEQIKMGERLQFFTNPITLPDFVEQTKVDENGKAVLDKDGKYQRESVRRSEYYVYNKKKAVSEYNEYVDKLKAEVWEKIFKETKFRDLITEALRERIEKQFALQKRLDITSNNINNFFEMLYQNRHNLMKECILASFDLMCQYDAKNKIKGDKGYKTNDAYKVNKKVIIPYFVEYDSRYMHTYSVANRARRLEDFDKALCFIMGKKYAEIEQSYDTLYKYLRKINEDWSTRNGKDSDLPKTCNSTFFRMDFFKAGTVHLHFLDDQVHRLFNQFVALERGWLAQENTNKGFANANFKK